MLLVSYTFFGPASLYHIYAFKFDRQFANWLVRELARELGFAMKVFQFLLARTTEAGSRTLVHAATQGPETHGQYMSDCTIKQPSSFVLSKEGYEVQNRMWSELAKKLEAIKPGVTRAL